MSESYWEIAVGESFDEHGIVVSKEQFVAVADDMRSASEMRAEAMGDLCIPNPQTAEIKELTKQLAIEREKVVCPLCKGTGLRISYGGTFQSISTCDRCRGEGKISP